MRYVFVLLVCLSLFAACNKPVSCLTDADCADGAYCRSTQCIEPSAEGDLNEVFEERIRPIVETGCGCHGPDSGRPWSYFATDDKDTEKLRRAIVTRAWAYDPKPAINGAEEGISRPAILSYVTGACGLGHPSVYSDLKAPQYRELELWFKAVVERLDGLELAKPDGDIEAVESSGKRLQWTNKPRPTSMA